ncbi:chromosome segregation protein SMC [Lentzea guizhouensis]|uniref:Chromosome segregation protein SMC n=1 Tax=Lentzea guizhouensis TaxID=1586287 RepID=A0A1B2HEV9_9PSEU|nr:AAA family ATPase [Lentzea guizhouensis]ANZ36251.1 chromosome segregation protein SMC [Lentzea guizhouensis]
MTDRPLESIEIEGYTSIRDTRVELGKLNVLVGANGAGKSNFIHALEMLGRIVDQRLGLFVGLNGGASALLHRGDGTAHIKLRLNAPPNAYEAVLVPAANDELIFEREAVEFQGLGHDRPWTSGLGSGQRETRLAESQEPVAGYVKELLRGCRVYHFHDTSRDAPVKQMVPTADNIKLRDDAGNLAAVLLALRNGSSVEEQASYKRIVGTIRLVAPFFRDFVLERERGDHLRLRWTQNDSDAVFSADQMSDGTLRFVCLATLLLHPWPPALVVLDEPELGLHPSAIVHLAELLRRASVHSQVIIATQSVTLMNQFELGDLIVVERVAGASVLTRPNADELQDWLAEYSLGELWEKNLLGGRPSGNS